MLKDIGSVVDRLLIGVFVPQDVNCFFICIRMSDSARSLNLIT